MKIESTSFTEVDYDAIVSDYFDRERQELIRRLRRVIEETEGLIPSLRGPSESSEEAWTDVETLAHMSVAAQFFGWLIYKIAKREPAGELIELLKLRDPAIVEAASHPPRALAEQLRISLQGTIAFLQDVRYDDLRNRIKFGSRELSGEDVVRISLVHHLEDHVQQIRETFEASAESLRGDGEVARLRQ